MITHEITAIVEGLVISDWQSGNVESSVTSTADSFVLRIPFMKSTPDIWEAVAPESMITIKADGNTMLSGFIDSRRIGSRSGLIEIAGRDRCGRLVDESAPAVGYNGMDIVEAIRRLASPWFSDVVLSGGENRRIRRGKGRRVAAETEPVVTINVRSPRRGKVHPGETRWNLIHEIASRAGLIVYAQADGSKLILGKPNQSQSPDYSFVVATPGTRDVTTVRDITVVEDWGDRFSMIVCGGVGAQGDLNYGEDVVDKRGAVFDDPTNRIDGTGRDFKRPKRMFMPERMFTDYNDAQRVARNEQIRRDFARHQVYVEVQGLGQLDADNSFSMFCIDTVASVQYDDLGIKDDYYMFKASYSFNRDNGDYTVMHGVPVGTEMVA